MNNRKSADDIGVDYAIVISAAGRCMSLTKSPRWRRLHITLIAFTWNCQGNETPGSINADHLKVFESIFVHSAVPIQQQNEKNSQRKHKISPNRLRSPVFASMQLDIARLPHKNLSCFSIAEWQTPKLLTVARE
jgi:hypothetical protein